MTDLSDDDHGVESSVRAAGDRTIDQYQDWMQINGAAHLIRSARESGIVQLLRQRQHTLEQLCESLSIDPVTTSLLLDGLVAIGFVEQYQDDFTLARAGHLLCAYDDDLGDRRWNSLGDHLRMDARAGESELNEFRNRLAATQWIHTAAAMQAAEILDSANADSSAGISILDLGCGSAVWSCAMAHRVASSSVVAIDRPEVAAEARKTAQSIGLDERFWFVEADPRVAELEQGRYDVVILAQLLSGFGEEEAAELLRRSTRALRNGGRLVAPDHYVGPANAGLGEALSRIAVKISTPNGRVRGLRHCQTMFAEAGLESIQFTYLTASQSGLGMMVGQKP